MQLNSFADIFLSDFIHRVWTPGVLQPFEIQRQMLRAHHHANWHQWKSLSKLLWHWTTECFRRKKKADTIHIQLTGQFKGKMSDPVNFFPCNYCMISTLKSIRNTIFLWSVFHGIIFLSWKFVLSFFLRTWTRILEASLWICISEEIANMAHILWLISLKCSNCIHCILQSILQTH